MTEWLQGRRLVFGHMGDQPETAGRGWLVGWLAISGALSAITLLGVALDAWPLIASRAATAFTYVDLNTVLAQSECAQAGVSGAPYSECSLPMPAGVYNYPPASFILAFLLRLDTHDVSWVGSALAVLWTCAAICLLFWVGRRFGLKAVLLAGLVLLAPGTTLMLQRGSNESLVWMSVAIATMASFAGRRWLASSFIALGTLLKFFPFGMVLLFIPALRRGRAKPLAYMVPIALAVLVTLPFLWLQSGRIPRPVGDAFGAAVFVHYFESLQGALLEGGSLMNAPEASPSTGDVAIAALVFLALLVCVLLAITRMSWTVPDETTRGFALGASAMLVVIYLSGTHYDYRLTFLVFGVVALTGIARAQASERARWLVMLAATTMSISTWMSIPMPRLVQVVGDVLIWGSLTLLVAVSVVIEWQARTVRPTQVERIARP